jgi:hypothetical protein
MSINKFISVLILSAIFFIACQKNVDSVNESSNISPNKTTSSNDKGEQIVAAYLKTDAAPFRKSRLRFTITAENEPTLTYEIDIWRKQTENETLTLSHIVKPAEDNDLSSLAVEAKDKEPVLTTFVASSDQFRETGANKSFFGGVPAEELLGGWSKFNYSLIGEKKSDEVAVAQVEGKLKDGKRSVASRILADFRTDNNLPAEIHLFDSQGKEVRTVRVKNYQTTAGRTYVSKMEIENLVFKTLIAVEVLSMEFPNQIDDSVFTREQLKKNAGK